MNVDLEDSNCDDDIFVVKQIKPVNKLTLQQALIIKYGVLNSLNSKKHKNKEKDKVRDRSSYFDTEKSQKGSPVASETSKKKSSKVDCHVPKSTRNSCKPIRNCNSGDVKKDLKQNTSEKEEKGCSLESELAEKSKSSFSPSHTSNILNNCTEQKPKNHEMSPYYIKKRKQLEVNESKKTEEPPMKTPKISQENNNVKVEEPSRKISSEKDEIVKTEIKLKEDIHTIENKVRSENLIEECEYSSKLKSDGFQSSLIDDVNNFDRLEEDRFKNNNQLLSFLLKKIICNETKKQIYLEEQSRSTGKIVEKLLSNIDCIILERFFKLDENAAQVFVRMLSRKKYWHRVSNIKYTDISNNLENEFQILHNQNFVDTNIEDEDIKNQLDLLSKQEVVQICRDFNISSKSSNQNKKQTLIDLLIEDSKKQRSVSDMFKRKASTDRLDLLKYNIKKVLGMCIKLSDTAVDTFYKIFLLHSFPHYTEEEDKRFSSELNISLQVHKNLIRFPDYKLSPTVVFETRSDFNEYKKALFLHDSLEIAINGKNHEEFVVICNKAKEELIRLLKNTEYQQRFLNLKPFLRKFSAGMVYARILTKYCQTFKKKSSNSDIIKTAQLLLDQNLFLTRKKGEWYEILSKALEYEKNIQEAAEITIKALGDTHISEVQRLTLQFRGQSILRKKSSGLTDSKLREELDDVCTPSVQEPSSIEITGKALSIDNGASKKSVYVQDCKDGKMYISVEERALSHYMKNGFTKGYHVEGLIVQSIYFLLFYDIIYGISVQGVFQSPYQEAPLDFYSASFYENRKEEIDLLLDDMLNWNDEEIEAKIKDVYERNYKTTCIIKWDDQFTPDLFFEIIQCITMPKLVLIFQRFIANFRVFRSGFPDLTLWNPQTKRCKFVEVKSPNDRLSDAQRVWLDYLRSIELDCEVCNVKNFSGKKLA